MFLVNFVLSFPLWTSMNKTSQLTSKSDLLSHLNVVTLGHWLLRYSTENMSSVCHGVNESAGMRTLWRRAFLWKMFYRERWAHNYKNIKKQTKGKKLPLYRSLVSHLKTKQNKWNPAPAGNPNIGLSISHDNIHYFYFKCLCYTKI